MNKFEATVAMVGEKALVQRKGEDGYTKYVPDLCCFIHSVTGYQAEILPGLYTIYQEPPKMKTWYKGYFKNSFGEIFEMGRWHDSLEKAKNYGYPFVTHEERQFPEVG